MSRLRQLALRVPLVVLAGALWVLADDDAQGQPTFQLAKIVRNPGPLAPADQRTLDTFLTKAFFPRFMKPAGPDDLPKVRRGYKRIVGTAGATPAHAYVNRKVLEKMLAILGDRNLPAESSAAIKYNALLMIADLNQSDAPGKVKPLPDAFKYLMMALGAPPSMDYMKPAALVGLARFAQERAIPKDRTGELTAKLLELVNEQQPPSGRNKSAHNYLRRGAAKVLATLGSTGPNNSVLLAFERIAADPQARPMLRCEMSRFIGELELPQGGAVDVQRLATILGHQTVEICKREIDQAKNEQRNASRRLIMYALDCSSNGLRQLAGVSERGSDASNFIRDLKEQIDGLYEKISDTQETADASIGDTVTADIGPIQAMLPAKPEALAAASDSKDASKPPAETK